MQRDNLLLVMPETEVLFLSLIEPFFSKLGIDLRGRGQTSEHNTASLNQLIIVNEQLQYHFYPC